MSIFNERNIYLNVNYVEIKYCEYDNLYDFNIKCFLVYPNVCCPHVSRHRE